jgi:hypothetical protein
MMTILVVGLLQMGVNGYHTKDQPYPIYSLRSRIMQGDRRYLALQQAATNQLTTAGAHG